MIFGGLTHDFYINRYIENTTAIFASDVDFKNPFITDYETRKENTYGARSFFNISNQANAENNIKPVYAIGVEWQQTKSGLANYANERGSKGKLTASGNILTESTFFLQSLAG